MSSISFRGFDALELMGRYRARERQPEDEGPESKSERRDSKIEGARNSNAGTRTDPRSEADSASAPVSEGEAPGPDEAGSTGAPSAAHREGSSHDLTQEEQREVSEMKQRDGEVRRHEQAHMAAGGAYAGTATFTYETGPDGGQYAVAGEVPIDASAVPNDPAATVQKMQVVQRAALAPADPSAPDRAIAAGAAQKEAQARQELLKKLADEAYRRAERSTSAHTEDEKTDDGAAHVDLQVVA
jgi:hypothetical protein